LWSALFLLLICGPASAQLVNVVGWQNGIVTPASNVHSVTGLDLDDSTTVLVVGMYGDTSPVNNGYTAVTFGGVPPTGLINNTANTRGGMAYWINPNTAAGQTLSFTFTSGQQGYYWLYQLSNVDTNAAVVTSGAQVQFGTTASLTTLTNNSFVVSYFSGNNSQSGVTINPPLTQTAATITGASAGASMASATNTIATPGLVNVSWNLPPANTLAQYGPGAFAFIPLNVGAPIVAASVNPPLTAAGGGYAMTVTIDPFHSGNVTNVSVDLSSIGGSAANALVQSSNPNVWTNSFIVPGGAPIGTANLIVTAKQDAAPITGTGSVAIEIATPSAPVVVQDTVPTTGLNMYVGQGVTFSASFSAPGSIAYRWQKSVDASTFTNIPGAVNTTYTIPSVTLGDAGYYRLQASNFLGTAESSATFISVNNAASAVYIWSAPIPFAGLTAEQILTNFPAANKIAGAMRAQNGGSPATVILTNAANRPVVFAGAGNWASLSGGTAYLSNVSTNKTGNASFDSTLSLGYNNNATHDITLGGLIVGQKYQVQLFGLDNRAGLTPAGSLQFSAFQDPTDVNLITSEPFAMADNVYVLGTFTASSNQMTIQQNLTASAAGNFNCLVLRTVGWEPAPYFALQPKSTNNFVGTAKVTLTGSAAGDATISNPTITYQWASGPVGGPYSNLADGSKYAGVTTATLTVSNLVTADSNLGYVLKVTDSGGTTVSSEARVYVQSLPVVPPANNSSFAGAVLTLTNNPNSRLIGLWQLNETNDPSTGLLVAYDASGKGRSGIYGPTAQNAFNGVQSPQPPAYGGFATNQGALQTGTGGVNDSASVINLPPLNITNGVDTTICMWIYPTATAGNLGGLLYNRGADQSGFGFGGTTGGPSGQRNLGFVWNNANGEATFAYNSGLFPVNNQWNFVVLVIRTNAATFYLDYVDDNGAAFFGKAADTAARYTQNNWSGSPIWIGGDPSAPTTTIFPGRISDVAVFNSALTDDQITQLFTAGFQVAGFPAGFTQQPPATQTTYTGFTLRIAAQTGGTSPVTNQWKFNGTNLVDGWFNGSLITGTKSNVLTIFNVSTNWQGVYTLAATNALGGSVSSDANVTVLVPELPPSGNLVGQWFNGTASLADNSGHLPGKHNAYGVGASATNYVFTNNVPPGKSGTSLSLFGGTSMGISNSWATDPGYVNTFDDGIATSFTVMAWAKGQPGVWNPFVSKNGESEGWQLRRGSGANAVFTLRGTVTPDPLGAAGGSGADGAWHHYVGTYDSATATRTLYVDGVVQNVNTGDISYTLSPNSRLVLGGRFNPPGVTNAAAIDGGANFTGGLLYDVRIYNTALTEAQQAFLAAPGVSALPAQQVTTTVTPGNPSQLVLSWLNGGKLLQATNLLGPWVTNEVAAPPYTVPLTNTAGYFRIVFP